MTDYFIDPRGGGCPRNEGLKQAMKILTGTLYSDLTVAGLLQLQSRKESEMRLVASLSTMLALSVPGTATAQPTDESASGSMTITVVIAPLAPILAAYDDGAAGLWSMTGGTRGLMLKLDDSIQPGEESSLELYTPVNGIAYRVAVAAGSPGQIAELGAHEDRGLIRGKYAIKSPHESDLGNMTLVIASL